LRSEILDRPLFAQTSASPASDLKDTFAAELPGLLQLTLPRAAAPLAPLIVNAVLSDSSESAALALGVMRAFKEDWIDVVQNQAVRSLERKLDALAYELQLQKSGVARRAYLKESKDCAELADEGNTSQNHIMVLASLCQALAQSRARAEEHWDEVATTLSALGCSVPVAGRTQINAAVLEEGAGTGGVGGIIGPNIDGLNGGTGGAGTDGLPDPADCEAAISAMVNKTVEGMRTGLQLLSLPGSPLHFVPGVELRLRGHDIRVAVNTMIVHWLQNEKTEFYEVLQRIRHIVNQPMNCPIFDEVMLLRSEDSSSSYGNEDDCSCLLKERSLIIAEHQALSRKLQALETRLGIINACLGDSETSSTLVSRRHGAILKEGGPSKSFTQHRCTKSLPIPPELKGSITSVAEALSLETLRCMERFAQQLQQRRSECLTALIAHLEHEQEQVTILSLTNNDALGMMPLGAEETFHEKIEIASRSLSRVCLQVEDSLNCRGHLFPNLELQVGLHCRAKWMDGNFYDATIQHVLGDGSIVVNWLRPRATTATDSPVRRPLATVSEVGGDDTLHRVIRMSDITLDDMYLQGDSLAHGALLFFERRPKEDLKCLECGQEDPDWASVSFGIYLCCGCAEGHANLGRRVSLVRPTASGWGWPQQDLDCLRFGGNAAFQTALAKYPQVEGMLHADKYKSRFAEYYRRNLDALCVGAQLPQMPSANVAAQPGSCDFLTFAEAMAVAREAVQQFQASLHGIPGVAHR